MIYKFSEISSRKKKQKVQEKNIRKGVKACGRKRDKRKAKKK